MRPSSSSIPRGVLVAALGALAGLASLWMPWYTIKLPQLFRDALGSIGAGAAGGSGAPGSASGSADGANALGGLFKGLASALPEEITGKGWQVMNGGDIAIAVATVGALLLLAALGGGLGSGVRIDRGVGSRLVSVAGLVVAAVAVYHLVSKPGASEGAFSSIATVKPGIYVALVGGVLMVLGGLATGRPPKLAAAEPAIDLTAPEAPEAPAGFAPPVDPFAAPAVTATTAATTDPFAAPASAPADPFAAPASTADPFADPVSAPSSDPFADPGSSPAITASAAPEPYASPYPSSDPVEPYAAPAEVEAYASPYPSSDPVEPYAAPAEVEAYASPYPSSDPVEPYAAPAEPEPYTSPSYGAAEPEPVADRPYAPLGSTAGDGGTVPDWGGFNTPPSVPEPEGVPAGAHAVAEPSVPRAAGVSIPPPGWTGA